MERNVTERTAGVLDRTLRMRDRAKRSRCGAWRCRNRRAWCIRQAPGYYAQYTALGNLMSLQSDGQMTLLAGMGLHGYEPRGFPRGIRPGGVIFDIPIAGVQLTDGLEREQTARFNQQIGLLSSALKHATPEQMFSTEQQPADAISAVKALSKANAQGQRIYQMTRDNMASTLPNLNLARETENEIRTALNAGLTVIAHTDNVSVPGWATSFSVRRRGVGRIRLRVGRMGAPWIQAYLARAFRRDNIRSEWGLVDTLSYLGRIIPEIGDFKTSLKDLSNLLIRIDAVLYLVITGNETEDWLAATEAAGINLAKSIIGRYRVTLIASALPLTILGVIVLAVSSVLIGLLAAFLESLLDNARRTPSVNGTLSHS